MIIYYLKPVENNYLYFIGLILLRSIIEIMYIT